MFIPLYVVACVPSDQARFSLSAPAFSSEWSEVRYMCPLLQRWERPWPSSSAATSPASRSRPGLLNYPRFKAVDEAVAAGGMEDRGANTPVAGVSVQTYLTTRSA